MHGIVGRGSGNAGRVKAIQNPPKSDAKVQIRNSNFSLQDPVGQHSLGYLAFASNSALSLKPTISPCDLIASEQELYPDLIDCNRRCLTKPESEWLVGGNAIRNLKAPAPSPQDRSSQAAAMVHGQVLQDLSRNVWSGSSKLHNRSRLRLDSGPEREQARTARDSKIKSQPNILNVEVNQTSNLEKKIVIEQKKLDSRLY